MNLYKKSDGTYALTIPEESDLMQEQALLVIRIREAKKTLEGLQARQTEVGTLLWKIQIDIPQSWKGWPSNTFMKDGKPVHVYELMPEGMQEFHGDWDEWRRVTRNGRGNYLNKGEKAAHFDEVDRAPCPKCGTLQPVIYDNGILSEDDIPPKYVRHIVICCGAVREVPRER